MLSFFCVKQPGANLFKCINVFCKIVMEFYIYNKTVLLEKITCCFDFFSVPSWGACRRWSLRCRPRWRWNQTSESWCRKETCYFSSTCSPHPHTCLQTHLLTWSFHIHPSIHVFRSASSQHCFCYRKIHPSISFSGAYRWCSLSCFQDLFENSHVNHSELNWIMELFYNNSPGGTG